MLHIHQVDERVFSFFFSFFAFYSLVQRSPLSYSILVSDGSCIHACLCRPPLRSFTIRSCSLFRQLRLCIYTDDDHISFIVLPSMKLPAFFFLPDVLLLKGQKEGRRALGPFLFVSHFNFLLYLSIVDDPKTLHRTHLSGWREILRPVGSNTMALLSNCFTHWGQKECYIIRLDFLLLFFFAQTNHYMSLTFNRMDEFKRRGISCCTVRAHNILPRVGWD